MPVSVVLHVVLAPIPSLSAGMFKGEYGHFNGVYTRVDTAPILPGSDILRLVSTTSREECECTGLDLQHHWCAPLPFTYSSTWVSTYLCLGQRQCSTVTYKSNRRHYPDVLCCDCRVFGLQPLTATPCPHPLPRKAEHLSANRYN